MERAGGRPAGITTATAGAAVALAGDLQPQQQHVPDGHLNLRLSVPFPADPPRPRAGCGEGPTSLRESPPPRLNQALRGHHHQRLLSPLHVYPVCVFTSHCAMSMTFEQTRNETHALACPLPPRATHQARPNLPSWGHLTSAPPWRTAHTHTNMHLTHVLSLMRFVCLFPCTSARTVPPCPRTTRFGSGEALSACGLRFADGLASFTSPLVPLSTSLRSADFVLGSPSFGSLIPERDPSSGLLLCCQE
jgi:hypothetical protein